MNQFIDRIRTTLSQPSAAPGQQPHVSSAAPGVGRMLGRVSAVAVVGGFVALTMSLRETSPRIIGTIDSGAGDATATPVATPANTAAKTADAPTQTAADAFVDRRALTTEAPPSFAAPRPIAATTPTPAPVVAAAPASVAPAALPPTVTIAAASVEPKAPAIASAPIASAPIASAPIASAPIVSVPVVATPPPPAAPVVVATPAPVVAPPTATPPPIKTTIAAATVLPPPRQSTVGVSCGQPNLTVTPADGGMMNIKITSTCRADEEVKIRYAGIELVRRIGSAGMLDMQLDLFAGASQSVDVLFGDGSRRVLPAVAKDLDRVSKVALIWRGPVNLDLHAYENAAGFGDAGHRWGKTPSSAAEARTVVTEQKRGHGFMSSLASGATSGDQLEVYTFVHSDEQTTGSVAMALDYESRGERPEGDMCGNGANARVGYEFRMLSRQGQTAGGTGTVRAADCGVPIVSTARYQPAGLPTLRIRKP